jgi:SPP1 gp7 family putative phage head morphogenesis protein
MHAGPLRLLELLTAAERLEDFEESLAEHYGRATDAAGLVEFFDVPTGQAFDVKPEQAINFFKAKGLRPTFSYADMLNRAHDQAFTVAKMMDVDLLSQMKASLDSAQANGQTFKEWADSITPILQQAGWWGRQQVVDPISGKVIVAQLGSPSRLETIFRTNMMSSYAAGQWQEIEGQKDIAPFIMYDAVDDFRTRPLHAKWDKTVLPVDSPWWNSHYPPNGWNCRCGVIQLSEDELEELGLKPATEAPNDGTYTWTNPRTGAREKVPQGLDPGFDNNSGKSAVSQMKALLAEKMKANGIAQKGALKEALEKQQYLVAEAAAADEAAAIAARQNTMAQQARANAASDQALAAAKAAAAKQAAEASALQQLASIAQGQYAGVGKGYLEKAYAKVSKAAGWDAKTPTAKLADVEAEAAAAKVKTETASKLATYKKAVLEGKIPAPSLVKALQSLPEADQATFLAKVDAEKAAIEAKKKAEAEAKAAAAAAAAKKAKASEAAKKAAATKAAKKAQQAAASPAVEAPEPEPAPAAQAVAVAAGTPPNPAKLVKIGNKTKGATAGEFVQDTDTGQKWLIKFPDSEDNVRNEVLAGKLYQLAGIETPELHLIRYKGKPALASRMIDGIREGSATELAANGEVMDGFAVDAWLANWDSIGLNFDNTVLKGTKAIRIDVGGSMRYRATGGLKGDAWGDEVLEIDTLRNPATAAQAAKVFGKITATQLKASAERVARLSDADIRALVEQYGPLDARDRNALADRLIARKQFIAERFGLVEKPPIEPPAPVPGLNDRVTASELKAIADSRANGYALTIDGPDLEDHQVVLHHFTRTGGEAGTRAWMKIRPDAQKKLLESIKASGALSTNAPPNTVSLERWRLNALAAIKGINKRAAAGENYIGKDIDRLEQAIKDSYAALLDIRAAKAKALSGAVLQLVEKEVTDWLGKFETALIDAKKIGRAQKIPGKFDAGGMTAVQYEVKAAPAAKPAAAPTIPWKRVNELRVEKATFDKSRPKLSATTVKVPGAEEVYEATLADGTVLRFVPDRRENSQAVKGLFYVDTPGTDAKAAARPLEILQQLGVNSTRASEVDRQVLYLNQVAEIRLAADRTKLKEFLAIDTQRSGQALVLEKLRLLKMHTGVDVTKSRGWQAVNGERQAFGHGRAYTVRPDLDTPEFDQFDREYAVYHNPLNLAADGSGSEGVADQLLTIINGGGQAASQLDRARRGAFAGKGTSVTADFNSGGADYFFTRIRARTDTQGPGFYWKAKVLKRTDAITYDGDKYGNTTERYKESRLGQTVTSFRTAARSRGNETIFKNGLSVFDDLDRVVVYTDAEQKRLIAELKALGYSKWPDGRALTDVIKVYGRTT